jgi:LCP family protein required for cell wall assembly
MSDESSNRAPGEDPPYRIYRGEQPARPGGRSARSSTEERPYTTYRSAPRGLRARLRGEDYDPLERERRRGRDGGDGGDGGRPATRPKGPWYKRITWKRGLAYLGIAIVAWLLLSLVLFLISAGTGQGIPQSAQNALSSGSNMITGTDTVLVIGTDQRPKGSKEPGANTNDKGSRSDTLMLWRIGGGTSRRLSIPRDTVANIPGYGDQKINAAYAFGGPALTIKTVERLTGVKINHVIIVNLAAFPQFIDAIGGIDVTTGRVCSEISGGAKNGGWTLNLRPGTHHLNGTQALVLARTRENRCNPAENDLTREKRQQEILNSIKSKLQSPLTFFHLPWASWYAPKTIRTDMGGPTLLTLFAAAELGGSAPVDILKPSGAQTLPDGSSGLTVTPGAVHRSVNKLMNG